MQEKEKEEERQLKILETTTTSNKLSKEQYQQLTEEEKKQLLKARRIFRNFKLRNTQFLVMIIILYIINSHQKFIEHYNI